MNKNTAGPEKKIYSVSEITGHIKKLLEDAFPSVWVEGEVSNFKKAHSGHLYFSLKDEASHLGAVMWRSSAAKIPFKLEDGLQVVCFGRINVYEPRGQYQLQVDIMEPKGKGSLQLAFEQLKEKLGKEGLFSPDKKKKIPLFPHKVGIVTSPRGAAVTDILQTLERRFARLHILIYPARVQGEGAADEIVAGVDFFNSIPDMDVIVVGRGGGSIEDLWAFNQEKVARAIYRSRIPVISAVGHEIDFTISDFVADVRASTPSGAAEILIEKEHSFVDRIESLEKGIRHHFLYFIREKRHQVMHLIRHQGFQNFKMRLLHLAQKVDELELRSMEVLRSQQRVLAENRSRTCLLEEKIIHILRHRVDNWKGIWENLAAQLHSLSPLNILKKGYTLCWKADGKTPVLNIERVDPGQRMRVAFHRGEFCCRVETVDKTKSIFLSAGGDKSGNTETDEFS